MTEPIRAIYENGVFKPLKAPDLPEHQPVRLIIEAAPHDPEQDAQPAASANGDADPLKGIRISTGIADLAEKFDDYRFGKRQP